MSDPITAQSFMASLSCNGGTREPLPSKLPPPEVLVPHLWDRALLVTEIADLRAQLADADKTLAGFVKAVLRDREPKTCWAYRGEAIALGMSVEDAVRVAASADDDKDSPSFDHALRARLLEAVGLKEPTP